jgi:hypothetical protein
MGFGASRWETVQVAVERSADTVFQYCMGQDLIVGR